MHVAPLTCVSPILQLTLCIPSGGGEGGGGVGGRQYTAHIIVGCLVAPTQHLARCLVVQEVEKEVEDEEGGGRRGRKRKITSMEYCYEAEMEGGYCFRCLLSLCR